MTTAAVHVCWCVDSCYRCCRCAAAIPVLLEYSVLFHTCSVNIFMPLLLLLFACFFFGWVWLWCCGREGGERAGTSCHVFSWHTYHQCHVKPWRDANEPRRVMRFSLFCVLRRPCAAFRAIDCLPFNPLQSSLG